MYVATNQPRTESVRTDSLDTGNVPAVVTFDEDVDNQDPEPSLATVDGQHSSYDALLTPETGTTSAGGQHDHQRKPLLPSFIARIPAHILPEDQDFLANKGAFILPEPDLREEILRAYLFSVHPFMPMLEVESFVRAVQMEDGHVSLLLFQAVMFAGLHSLKPEVVQRLGFKTVKQAREVFFDRARLLYDFNVEVDEKVTLQSLILMSSWYSKRTPWNEKRQTWHWTGLAYDLARSIGLHREPSSERTSVEMHRFRRRLWWSLYIRDRLIALGTRRPMRIHDDEYDVTMLTLDDFNLESGTSDVLNTDICLSREEATSTALMCIQLARLCICIGRVVSSQYTTIGSQAGTSHTMMIMPKGPGDHTDGLEECETQLLSWSDELASNVRRSDFLRAESACTCSEVHWSELNMTYLTVVNVLHRAQALRSQPDGSAVASPSRLKVKSAARKITKLGQEMLQKDQVRFLGLVGVTAFLAACLTHMLDARCADEDVRDASTFRLYQTLQALQALREVYASADSAFSFLASVTRKAGIYMPVQADSPTVAFISSSPGALTKAAPPHPSRKMSSSSWPAVGGDPARSIMNDSHVAQTQGGPADRATTTHPSTQLEQTSDMTNQPVPPFLEYNDQGNLQTRSISSHSTIPPHLEAADSGKISNIAPAGFNGRPNQIFAGNTIDWNTGNGIGVDFEYMPFTYDFFSDAFGFLDGDLSGL